MAEASESVMQCMEVWGGNRPLERRFSIAGLDVWVYSRPCGSADAGGDVHYISSCATGRITRLLVADVSGHGDVVARTSLRLRDLMRQYVNYIDQKRFVAHLNDEFTRLAEAGRFATAVVMTYFGPTGEISLSNAGHPPPFVYRGSVRRWERLEEDEADVVRASPLNLPLGVLDGMEYEQLASDLAPGDALLCYTDAFLEVRDEEGEPLGVDGLLRRVNAFEGCEPERLVSEVVADVNRLGGGDLVDDATMLLLRPTSDHPWSSLRTRLATPVRVLRGLVRARRNGDRLPWPEPSLANLGGAMFSFLNRGRHR